MAKAKNQPLEQVEAPQWMDQLALLVRIINPGLFVILVGGLFLHFDVGMLAFVGIVGYAIWGVMNFVLRRKRRQLAIATVNKKRKKNKQVEYAPGFDYGLVASLLNPITLIVLIAGVLQAWPIPLLVAIGVVGYGLWGFFTYMDRKHPQF